jgi:hypothetical protein
MRKFLDPPEKYTGRGCFAVVLVGYLSRQLGHREKKDQERERVAIHTDCYRGGGGGSKFDKSKKQ